MDCCGGALTRREWMWSTLVTSAGALVSGWGGAPARAEAAEPSAAALQVLKDHISVDVHSHGGPTGVIARTSPTDDLARSMRAGRLSTVCLADVPDSPLLGLNAAGGLAAVRQAASGELYRHHLDRLKWIDDLVTQRGVRRALTVADLKAAHDAGAPAIVADVEGLDFLDGRLERLEESYKRGVRHVQLVHYTPNEIGDFQTGAVTHNGLTRFGADVIRACNRLGLVIDVAHGTAEMVKQALQVSDKPLLLSHTALEGSKAMGSTRLAGRQISREHARAVAEAKGSIGIWHFFPSLEAYVDGLREMVDVVGVEHVSIGTDQQRTPGSVQDYAVFATLVDAMLRAGFRPDEVGKIIGGNYVRIFEAAAG